MLWVCFDGEGTVIIIFNVYSCKIKIYYISREVDFSDNNRLRGEVIGFALPLTCPNQLLVHLVVMEELGCCWGLFRA